MVNQTSKLTGYQLNDLGNVILNSIEKITLKRYSRLKPKLQEVVSKESEKFFKYVDSKVTGVHSNPFHFYSSSPWPDLSPKYVRYKKRKHRSSGFWSNKKKLHNWFQSASPAEVFGNPYIDIRNYNPTATGLQWANIRIEPFPRKKINLPTEIYNRLFGKRKIKSGAAAVLGTYVSNDDIRPIISPAMRQLINYSIKRKVVKTIKETLSNGK